MIKTTIIVFLLVLSCVSEAVAHPHLPRPLPVSHTEVLLDTIIVIASVFIIVIGVYIIASTIKKK